MGKQKHPLTFLNNYPIRSKILIAPLVLILALAIISGVSIYGFSMQSNALRTVNDITLQRITLIDRFALLSEQVQSDVYQISVLRFMGLPEEEIQAIQTDLEIGVNELKIIYGEISTKWPLDSTELKLVNGIKPNMDEFSIQAKQAANSVMDNPSFGVLMVRASMKSFNEFREPLNSLLNYQHEKIAQTQKAAIQTANLLKSSIIAFMIFTALLGITTSIYISDQLIAQPIQKTTRLMSMLAENDLSIELRGLDRNDEIGAMVRAVEVFRDNAIEKARLDQQLKESEQRLLRAQEVAHVGNWELDLATQKIWASEEAFRIYGLDRESPYLDLAEVKKIPLLEDRQHLDAAMNALLTENKPYNIQFRINPPNQSTPRVIRSLASLSYDENGTPEKVIGVIQDITELMEAEAALRQSEDKFSKAFQTSSYALTITRPDDGKFIDVNEAFTTITGYSREEALSSSSIALKLWVNEEDRDEVISQLKSGKAVMGKEFQFRNKQGKIYPGLFSAQIIQLDEGQCILSSINDITERKLAEENLKMYSTELQRSNKELEQFAYVASHDLQEPLRMVSNYLQLLVRRYKDKLDGDALEFIEYAVDGSNRMKTLINDLLTYSRVTTRGKAFTKINCNEVFNRVLLNLKLSIEENHAEITSEQLPTIIGDEIQLTQLFQNLLVNAIKFHSETPPRIHLGVKKMRLIGSFPCGIMA